MAEEKEKEKEKEKDERDKFLAEERELFESRTILISAPVNAKLAHLVNSKLLAMERANSKDPIYLFINSPGGEVHSGFSIFDTARFIEPKVVTVVVGLAASMGSIIALCAPRERRFAFPNSKFLIHQPSISGGLGGSVSDIEIHARDLLETKNHIVQLYAQETGRNTDEIRKALDRDNWMSPRQALEYGLISKVIERRADLKIQ
jgi:ATP-dependent Clp protease protease subunit